MKLNEFYDLVARMRAAQKKYFRTKDANVLHEAMDLEKEVDKAIKDHEEDKIGLRLF